MPQKMIQSIYHFHSKEGNTMNKIYKVIWSKAKHTYVVASEIAKGHTKGETTGKGLKKLAAAMLVAAALLSPSFAWAADTVTVEPAAPGSTTAEEVYTKEGTDKQIDAANKYTYRKAAELDKKLTDQKTSTALHVSKDENLIVGTKENHIVKNMKINGQLTSGSISTGDIISSGNVTVAGKMAADGVTDETTKDGSYIKQNNTVGNNLVSLDKQVKANDERITNVKEYVLSETNNNYVSKTDAAVEDGAIVKKANTIGQNVAQLDAALAKETAARLGADAAQDKVIQQVNDNLVASVNTINESVKTTNENMAAGFTALSQTDAAEAAAREAKDNELNERITNEANAIHDEIKAGDKALDERITNVKEYVLSETVSKADAAVQDGAIVKAANTIGENVTKLDAALAKETAARLGADAAQDKVIKQVNDNAAAGIAAVNTALATQVGILNQNDATERAERMAADAAETAGRVAADTKLVEATNGGLSLDNDNVLQKTKTEISSTGEVKTSKEAATTLIINKKADNQVKIDSEGVTVGLTSTQMDAEGFTAGGHDYDAAGAALMSDGRIKGANGDFTVDTKGNVTSTATVKGATLTDGTATISNGNIKTNGGFIQTGGGNVNTQGGEVRTNGGKVATSGGEINTGSGDIKTVGGNILTAGGKLSTSGGDIVAGTGNISGQNITARGLLSGDSLTVANGMTGRSLTLTGGDLDAGAGTIKTTGEVDAGTLNVSGKATVKDLEVKGEFKAETLTSWVDANNNTTINGGNVTSVNSKVDTDDGKTYTSTSKLTEKGRTDTAAVGNITNVSTQTATESKSTIENSANTDVTQKSYITQNLKNILQGIQNGDNATTVDQTETGIKSTATDGKNTASTNLSNGGFNTYATDGTNKTYTKQTAESLTSQIGDDGKVKSVMNADGITNNAVGGTISNSAKDLVNTATGNMTNTVGGTLTTTVTGKVTEDYKSDLDTKVGGNETHYVKGNQTNTVSGDRTVSVKGTETENFNAQVTNIKTDQRTSVGGNQTNIVAGNQQNTVSGSKTETVKGSVTEKYGSQATTVDGDQSTNVGGNQSNVVAGNQTNTISGSKTESVKGAVTETYGSQTTKVNGDQSTTVAGSQTNSITGDQVNTIGGNQTTTVTGDSSLSAKNISNTASETLSNSAKNINNSAAEKLSNSAAEIENKATTSINNSVGDNVSSSMTINKITESVKDGTKSNTFTKTVDKDINIVTDGINTSTESQLAGSVNTSLKNGTQSLNNKMTLANEDGKAEDVTKITDTASGAFSSSSQKADSITNTVKDGTNTSEVKQTASEVATSAKDISNTATEKITSQIGDGSAVKSEMTADGITNTATKITNITGNNKVTSDTKGTTFENTDHSTAIGEGTITKTAISGNTMETGKATMDYAEVMKDLGVHGKATIDGDTSVGGKLSVTGTSTLTGDVTMKSNATVEKDLTVNGKSTLKGGLEVTNGTTTDKLKVTGSSEFGGAATFNDIVKMNKGLSVTGGVTADSYKVGDKTYIDKDGINANNQVIKNVGQGDISEGSHDAVSGGQLYETNTRVSGLETRMGTVETKVDKLDNKIDKVGANAAAMANLHPLEFDEDSKWNIAAAVGSSGSETASAVGVFYRPNENVMVNASAAMGTGENMFGGGVSLRLGHGGNKAKDAQMKAAAKENRELRAKVDDLTARMDALLSVLNPNMSKDFPDVPENHWAYEAVSRLAGNGIVEGYEDGKYHGERQMTRYEMAEIIYNALSKGAKAEKKLVEEFRPELQAMAAQKKA